MKILPQSIVFIVPPVFQNLPRHTQSAITVIMNPVSVEDSRSRMQDVAREREPQEDQAGDRERGELRQDKGRHHEVAGRDPAEGGEGAGHCPRLRPRPAPRVRPVCVGASLSQV